MKCKRNPIYFSVLQTLRMVLLILITGNCYAEWQSEDAAIMGTTIRVEVWHPDAKVREQGIAQALEEMERVNRLMSPYIEDSQLSKINAYAVEGPVEVNRDLYLLIQKSLEFSELTHGVFDITYASVGHLFNYRKQIKPSEAEFAGSRIPTNHGRPKRSPNKRVSPPAETSACSIPKVLI